MTPAPGMNPVAVPSPPLILFRSLPVNSRLDFGMPLTLVRFVEALDFVAMIFVFSFLVLELLSVRNNSGPASEVAVIVLPETMLSITDTFHHLARANWDS